MTLSRSRSVRPVPTVTELLQERSARVIESSRHTRGTGMGLSGGRIVGEWYEVPDPLASRRWTVVLGALLAINFADDQINPPEVGVMERLCRGSRGPSTCSFRRARPPSATARTP